MRTNHNPLMYQHKLCASERPRLAANQHTKAGCRRGSCICASHVCFLANLGAPAWLPFSASWAAMRSSHCCILCSCLDWEVSTFALESDGLGVFAQPMHYLGAATVGYLTSAYVSWHGLSHRGVPNKIRILLYTPLHWLLLSAAAWLAALELLWGPFRWRKTEHGLDDASRRERATKSLLELERLVSGLIKRGELAQIQD